MLQEKAIRGGSGWLMATLLAAGIIVSIVALANSDRIQEAPWVVPVWILVVAVDVACWFGLTVVNPNTAKVVLLFGDYKGTLKTPGFRWVNPLTARRAVSLKVRNFESSKLKVNDHIGNPIEIAAIVVW